MDRILTRPIHSLFQIILERMELESLIGAITGIIVMSYAAMELQLSFTGMISSYSYLWQGRGTCVRWDICYACKSWLLVGCEKFHYAAYV